MSKETDYPTPAEMESDSASEWGESNSDPDWEESKPARSRKKIKKSARSSGRKNNRKAHAPPSIPTAPFLAAPSAVPSFTHSISSQDQIPNDQDKYPDLPDYMPYMPKCVPQASPPPGVPAQQAGTTAEQMKSFIQQHNGAGIQQIQGVQGAGQLNPTPGRSQAAGQYDFITGLSFQDALLSSQPGIKTEYEPVNNDLLMNYSGMGLSSWFDPSTGQFRPLPFPQIFGGNGFDFNFAAAMPFALPGPQLAMDPSPFALSGTQKPSVDAERISSKPKASPGANANTIPLLCILCEKTPKFSDVSHLLTHISSKGHLSRRFHIELQAQTDQDAEQLLDRFDLWFKQHGIQQLLTTRQEAKDQKKRTQVRRQRGVSNEKSRRSSYTRVALKSETDDTLQLHLSHLNPLNQQNWHSGVAFDNSYQTPSNKRAQSVYPEPDSPQKAPYQNDEPMETGKQAGSRTPTLKGVIHEGMGMFDAATPEMKRVRNQRKHPSVIDKMMLVSESISMTEQVWNESMTKIEHERSVYDTPTDLSSPVFKDEDDDEPLPKKPRGPRAVRKPSDPASERLTRSATRAMKGASTRASRGGKRGGRRQGGAQRGRGKKASKAVEEELDSDEELDLRHGKRKMSVFHDAPTGIESLGADVFGGRPLDAQGFAGNPFGGQQAGFPQRNAMQGLPSNQPLSSMLGRNGNHPFVTYDKENDRSAFPMQQTPNISGYYQPRQNMQTGAFNPLYVQRQDSLANVFNQGFDHFKPSSSAFQSLNGMAYNGMHGVMNNSLSNDLHAGFSNDVTRGVHNGFNNNTLSNDGLSSNANNGLQFRSGNHIGQNNGFDAQ